MKAYKIVRLETFFVTGEPVEDYRHTIIEFANQGWELVQVFSPSVTENSLPRYYDLIFSKESNSVLKDSEYDGYIYNEENKIAQKICQACQRLYDPDYSKCPHCKYSLND